MIADLIFDVGAHVGDDTDFYLAKGFRVVAIEAHPGFCAQLRQRFAKEIDSGRLDILNVAIAEEPGLASLLESQADAQWSTTDADIARTRPGDFRTVVVPAIPFNLVLEQFGIPYYAKVDIEGCEKYVLKHFQNRDSLPRYVSIEVNSDWAALTHLLQGLGYSRFKLVNQAHLHEALLPRQAREGKWIEWRFRGYTSGPFGDETEGEWIGAQEFARYAHDYLTHKVGPADWFDIHAGL